MSAVSRLSFCRVGAGTAVDAALARAPLRLLTPKNHGTAAWAYTTNLGGGLVGGDDVRLSVSVGAFARAVLSSQGATRIYRSSRGTRSDLNVEVAEHGLLALLPDPTACFAGAHHEQRIAIALGTNASLIFADTITAGRRAHGERWAFGRYRASLRITVDGRPLIDEALLLDPRHGALADRLGRIDCLATVVLVGPLVAPQAAALAALIGAVPQVCQARLLESASPLGSGLVLRLAGESAEELASHLRARLAFLPALLGDDPFARRA